MSNECEYSLECPPNTSVAVLRGVLRLPSTESYDRVFEPLRQRLQASAELYTIDLRDVLLMNSSGIRVLAKLVLFAKERGVSLRIRVRDSVPWQRKTVASLKLLDSALVVGD